MEVGSLDEPLGYRLAIYNVASPHVNLWVLLCSLTFYNVLGYLIWDTIDDPFYDPFAGHLTFLNIQQII
jgi:hypothetical protein